MTRHPSEIVLRGLRSGQEIHGTVMTEDGRVASAYAGGGVVVPWDVNDFLKWCENIPEQDLVAIAGTTALRNMP